MQGAARGTLLLIVLLGSACDRPTEPEALLQQRGPSRTGIRPDLETVVPQHLQVVSRQQQHFLRFTNGIANTGAGALHLRPRLPLAGTSDTQDAIQDVFDAAGNVVESAVVSQYEFHPTHNHWHIDAVAMYELRMGSPTGPRAGGGAWKTTFCLIDWIRMDGVSSNHLRRYVDCNADAQGISPGWIDQYNQAVGGQELDITGLPAGRYVLVSTANPDGTFLEMTRANNQAWVAFDLSLAPSGKPQLQVVGTSPCAGALCGAPPNR